MKCKFKNLSLRDGNGHGTSAKDCLGIELVAETNSDQEKLQRLKNLGFVANYCGNPNKVASVSMFLFKYDSTPILTRESGGLNLG